MTKYISAAETAKLVRLALKESFPGVKFSVRSHSYSGGASINIGWIDGPNVAQVDAVADTFSGAYFDGMTDYKGSNYNMLDGERVRFGADFIHTYRDYSDAMVERAIAKACKKWNFETSVAEFRSGGGSLVVNANEYAGALVRKELAKMSDRLAGKPSPTVARVKFLGDDGYGSNAVGRVYPAAVEA